MTGRHPPSYNNRFDDRPPSRSPPRYGDRRPSGSFNNFHPRGRGGPPSHGHRGRGGFGHYDGPDRGPPPFVPQRDRPSHNDRRDRAPSPPRNSFRDGPSPRPINTEFRGPRDSSGSYSTDTAYPESPAFASPNTGQGNFAHLGRGRGRGRPDADPRDRFRDRPSAPLRRPSPPPWSRENSRDSRDDWKADRPEEDWRNNRPGRERDLPRDPTWARTSIGSQRPEQRFDARSNADTASRPPTPSQNISASQVQSADGARYPESRRPSSGYTSRLETSGGQDTQARSDAGLSKPRASSPTAMPSVPAFGMPFAVPTPVTPAAPQVPVAPSSTTHERSVGQNAPVSPPRQPNVQTAQAPQSTEHPSVAMTSQANSAVTSLSSEQPGTKPIPTAPKAQRMAAPQMSPPAAAPAISGLAAGQQSPTAQRVPPAAPRGPRGFEPASNVVNVPARSYPPVRPVHVPTGPASQRGDDRSARTPLTANPLRDRGHSAESPSFRSLTGSVISTGPSEYHTPRREIQTSPMIENRPIPTGPAIVRDTSKPLPGEPMPNVPTGPRASSGTQQSPRPGDHIIPTAPRADRDRVPPLGPRSSAGSVSSQLSRPVGRIPVGPARPVPTAPRSASGSWDQRLGARFRETNLPAKRDASGNEWNVSPRTQFRSTSAVSSSSAHPSDYATVDADGFQPPLSAAELARTDRGRLDDIGDPIDGGLDDSSTEDEMDLDDDDFASTEAEFARREARLIDQIPDLSHRLYRMTTPLEQIARIDRINEDDIPSEASFTPELEAPDLDEEDSRTASGETEDADQELLTPKEEDVDGMLIDSGEGVNRIVLAPRLRRAPTPEVIHLPYLATSTDPDESLYARFELQDQAKASALESHLRMLAEGRTEQDQDRHLEYVEITRELKRVAAEIDHDRAEAERIERQRSVELSMEPIVSAIVETPTTEGSRRLHKFSSEYDIQKVLKESEEMARLEQEKLDRDAQKAHDSQLKEALVPRMQSLEERQVTAFVNHNSLRQPEQLIELFAYQPPPNDFTEEEQRIFIDAFKERPKKWGEISSLLPGKTYQHCIHHYYAFKWDGRFRETKGKRRKGGAGRGRGGRVAARGRGSALMADLGRIEDDVPPISNDVVGNVSGRPKRAAAARGAAQETLQESRAGTATPGKKSGKEPKEEQTVEKPVRRKKAGAPAAEKGPRRSKTQQLAAAGSAPQPPQGSNSPTKVDKESFMASASDLGREEASRMDVAANLLANFHAGAAQARNDNVPVYHTDTFAKQQQPLQQFHMPPATGAVIGSAPTHTQSKSGASSYWSVPEQNDFKSYLKYFGTDFAAIAAQMGTKTQTMIKNHYQRKCEGAEKEEYTAAAENANMRRQRGEDLGPPPSPTPVVKRRYDSSVVATPRTAVEKTEMDDVAGVQNRTAVGMTSSVLPRVSQVPLQVALGTAAGKGSALPVSRPGTLGTASLGPRMGYFTEEGRPQQQALTAGRPPPQPLPLQEPALLPGSPAWFKSLAQEQDKALNLERAQGRTSQEQVPQILRQPGQPQLAPDSKVFEQMPQHEERGVLHSIPSTLRQDSISLPTSSVLGPLIPPPTTSQVPSPPKMTGGFRPSSVPVPHSQAPMLQPGPPQEPRKTSNITSILNSEPEEPRQAKRMSDHSIHSLRVQSPASAARVPTPTGPGLGQRRDTFGSTGHPRSYYDRPVQTTPGPAPPIKYESAWSNLPPTRRDDWPPRPSISQHPGPSASPGPGPQDRDRQYYSHRPPTVGGMHTTARSQASPPPHPQAFHGHSRTSSLSAAGPPHLVHQNSRDGPPPSYAQQQHHQQHTHMSQHNSPTAPPLQYQQRRTSRGDDPRSSEALYGREAQLAYDRDRERAWEADRQRERDAAYAEQARFRPGPGTSVSSGPAPLLHAPIQQGSPSGYAPRTQRDPRDTPLGPAGYRHEDIHRLPPSGGERRFTESRYPEAYYRSDPARETEVAAAAAAEATAVAAARQREIDRMREAEIYRAREEDMRQREAMDQQREREARDRSSREQMYRYEDERRYSQQQQQQPHQAATAPPPTQSMARSSFGGPPGDMYLARSSSGGSISYPHQPLPPSHPQQQQQQQQQYQHPAQHHSQSHDQRYGGPPPQQQQQQLQQRGLPPSDPARGPPEHRPGHPGNGPMNYRRS